MREGESGEIKRHSYRRFSKFHLAKNDTIIKQKNNVYNNVDH